MESVLMGHPERIMPFVVPAGKIYSEDNTLLAEFSDNHLSQVKISLAEKINTSALRFEFEKSLAGTVAITGLRCW
jgi:hypothetical protein